MRALLLLAAATLCAACAGERSAAREDCMSLVEGAAEFPYYYARNKHPTRAAFVAYRYELSGAQARAEERVGPGENRALVRAHHAPVITGCRLE